MGVYVGVGGWCVCVDTVYYITHLLDQFHIWSLLVPRSVCLVVVFEGDQTPLLLGLQAEAVCVRVCESLVANIYNGLQQYQ